MRQIEGSHPQTKQQSEKMNECFGKRMGGFYFYPQDSDTISLGCKKERLRNNKRAKNYRVFRCVLNIQYLEMENKVSSAHLSVDRSDTRVSDRATGWIFSFPLYEEFRIQMHLTKRRTFPALRGLRCSKRFFCFFFFLFSFFCLHGVK